MKVTPTWRAFAPPAPPAVWVQLSGGHAWEGTTPKAVAALAGSALGVRGEPCRVLLLGRGLEELPGAGYVAEGGSGVQAEDSCQAQGIGAGGHGFFELAVDAQGLDGRGVAAQGGVNPGSADRPGIQGGLGVDERVRVGGSWPSGAALLEPKSET